jgi:hypothetical protein
VLTLSPVAALKDSPMRPNKLPKAGDRTVLVLHCSSAIRVAKRFWQGRETIVGYNEKASREGAPLSGGEASTVGFACIGGARHNCIGMTALFSNAHNSGIRRLIFRVPPW